MTIGQNQFRQSVVKGFVDLGFSNNVVSCRVKSNEATALKAGQAVKIVDSVGGTPEVTAVAADTDKVFGVVNYNIKNASFAAGSMVEISIPGNCVYMEASAAIARGASVMVVVTDEKVATGTEGKAVLGMAYDKAAADGDLIRVILTPSYQLLADGYAPQATLAPLAITADVAYLASDVQAALDRCDAIVAKLEAFGVLV